MTALTVFLIIGFDVVMLTHALQESDASAYSLGAYGSDWQTGYRIVS